MRNLTLLAVLIFLLTIVGAVLAEEAAKPDTPAHAYVGAKKCKICHKKDGIFEDWSKSKHATSFDSLSAEDQKNADLKKYYTTGTTAKGELLTGVQCEACHGAGADYKKKKIMENQELAITKGLMIPDEKTCLKCHNDKAPAALAAIAKDFDFEKMVLKGVHAPAKKVEKKAAAGK
jgi:hypothetical protein